MEPQKIKYPETFNVDIDYSQSSEKAKEILSLLKSKGYNNNNYTGDTVGPARYIIINKKVIKCTSLQNSLKEEGISYKNFKKLIEVIDIINTGTFIFTTEISDKIETEFIRNFFDNLGFNRSIWETNSSGLLYCFDDFIITHTEFPSFISNSPRITEKDIQLILKHCNLTKKEQNMTQEKKIVGYVPKNEEFDKAIRSIFNMTEECGKFNPGSRMYDKLIKLGVLELWCEPIYEETEKEVTVSGTISLKIKDKKVFHKNEDITNYVTEIAQIWRNLKDNSKIAGYDFIVDDVVLTKTGCENKNTKLSGWYDVYLQIK